MSTPTIGITVLIVLCFTSLCQLILQGYQHKKRHKELQERLEKLESLLDK